MAIIKRSLIKPSGVSGDFVFRVRNKKLVMYRRPVKQQVSQSPAAKSARSAFAFNTKFAVYINSFPYLKLAWKKAKVKGSNHFQKIIKSNAQFTKKSGISVFNIITPPGVNFLAGSLSLMPASISFNIPLASEDLKNFFQPPFILHTLFYFYEPKRKITAPYELSGIVNETTSLPVNNSYSIRLSLDETIKASMKKYEKVIIYIAASLSEPDSKKIFWTSTYSSEILI